MGETGLVQKVQKIVSYFTFDREEDVSEEAGSFRERIEKVVPMAKRMRTAQISIVNPQTFDDAQRVADSLKEGKAVILNLCKLDVELGKRIVDFVSGIVYALEGDTKKVGENIFVFTPSGILLSVAEESGAEKSSGGFFFEER